MEIEINPVEIGNLLKSQECASMLSSISSDIASRAGASVDVKLMPTRQIAAVYTENIDGGDAILGAL